MPRSAQPETGRVFAVPAQYGGTVYVNKRELELRSFVQIDGTAIFGMAMLLYFALGTTLGWWVTAPKHFPDGK
jgi:hypothetical protein